MRTARSLLRLLSDGPAPPAEVPGPIGAMVDAFIDETVRRHASDLHLDPAPPGTRLRLRVDGFFEEGPAVPADLHERLVARVKVLAGLTVYRRDEVQEGAIRRPGGVDLRVSVLPTVLGEKVTIRVFDPEARPFVLGGLGFLRDAEARLAAVADSNQGTVLIAGPSGSGKTTTLYALLRRIARTRGDYANLCSVEDPVEFALPGVHQVPVQRERGTTFARALAALMRQDPEVILVGEVRDPETAAIAIEAGMTGHLVLSSVHAGSASEAATRLLDLGVEPFAASSSLRAVVAQRLVRRVCGKCEGPDPEASGLAAQLAVDAHAEFVRGAGCDACRGTGFRGRLPLVEVLEIDRETARLLLERPDAAALADRLAGGRSLLEDGIARAIQGDTTLGEVVRVLDVRETRP